MEDEQNIVEQAKTNPEAFGILYDRYYQPIYGYLLKRVGHVELANDLTSETFFHALKNLHRYTNRGKPFKSWLFAIAVARVGNYFRTRSKYLEVTTDACPELVGNQMLEPDVSLFADEQEKQLAYQLSLVAQFLDQLKPIQKEVITLRYFSALSVKEVSDILGLKEGTVKSHTHRAIKCLEGLLEKELVHQPYVSTYSPQHRSAPAATGH